MKNNIKHIWRLHLTFLIASTRTKEKKKRNVLNVGIRGLKRRQACRMPRNSSVATVFAGISEFELHEYNLCVTYISLVYSLSG